MDGPRTNELLAALAATHHGLVLRREALAEGISHSALQRRVQNKMLERVGPETYRVSGSVNTWEQRALLACWTGGPGALLSHRAAALGWQLDGYETAPFEVLTDRWARRPRDHTVKVHEARDILSIDRRQLAGIPITSPLRTVLDLASVSPARRVEQAMEDGLRRKLFTSDQLAERFGRFARKGKPGISLLRPLVEERAGNYVPTASEFESIVLRLARRAGLPEPERQYPVALRDTTVYLDLAWPQVLLLIECDGLFVHGTSLQLHWDDDRQNELVLAGWLPIRLTWRRVTRQPEEVIATLQEAWTRRSSLNLA